MQSEKANELLNKAIKSVEKNGIVASAIVPHLKAAREYALLENDPLLTRALRLAWQNLEANDAFETELAEEIETPEDNLVYFLSLCLKSENVLNRDELRLMTNGLQQVA